MQAQVPASIENWISILVNCKQDKSFTQAKRLFPILCNQGLDFQPVICNYLIPALIECGNLHHAQSIFGILPIHHRLLCTWNVLISAFADYGEPQHSLQLFHIMQNHLQPCSVTFVALLNACGKLQYVDEGQELHRQIICRGLEVELFMDGPVIGNALVSMYGKCGYVADANKVFSKLPVRDSVSWNSIAAVFIEQGMEEKALDYIAQMVQEGAFPNSFTFVHNLKACGTVRHLENGQGAHIEIIKSGSEMGLHVGSSLINMYIECGCLEDAHHVFCRLPIRDVVSWNVLIAGYAEFGLDDKVRNCVKNMMGEGVCPDSVTYGLCLKACLGTQDLEKCQELHSDIVKQGFESKMQLSCSLFDVYADCGLLVEAHRQILKFPSENVLLWSAAIAAHVKYGLCEEAIDLHRQMQLNGLLLDNAGFASVLKACIMTKALEVVLEVHAELVKRGSNEDVDIATGLVEVYMDAEWFAEACDVAGNFQTRNIILWNALISGYAKHGLDEDVQNCNYQMLLYGVSPDSVTYITSLKCCGSTQASPIGQGLHAEVVKRGLESEVRLGSTIVDTYGKCGLLDEACYLLDVLWLQDAASWNAVLGAFVECGLDDHANFQFWKLLEQGVVDSVTFICSLKACSSMRDSEGGQLIHMEAIKRGFETELVIGNTLLNMYIICNSFVETYYMFDVLPVQDAISWNIFITGYVTYGLGEEALKCFKQMELEGVCPLSSTIVFALKACAAIQSLEEGQAIHSQAVKRGLQNNLYVGSTLVDMYAECRSVPAAHYMFTSLPIKSVASLNSLIARYGDHRLVDESLACFHQMPEDMSPGAITYICCLKSCGIAGALDSGIELHAEITKRGIESDLNVANKVVDMYIKCGSLLQACKVFSSMKSPDTISWNTLAAGYLEHGQMEEAAEFFHKLLQQNTYLDNFTIVCSLKASGSLQMGQEIHQEAVKRSVETELHVTSALIDMYIKFGSLIHALQVFDGLSALDSASWNALIGGYIEHGLGEEAIDQFEEMQYCGINPDCITFVSILKACCITGNLELGRKVYVEITKRGLERELKVGSSLVDMYGECGSLAETMLIFRSLFAQSDTSWTVMIKAYGKNHEGKLAIQCFKDMEDQGVKPSAITFLCLLTACSHSNLVHEGQQYFELMKGKYGIQPTYDHFTCMADLFARSGLFEEVNELIAVMETCPSEMILYSMLSACKSYGKWELAHKYFQQLVEANQESSSAYLLMADIYASAGMWEESRRLEEARIHSGTKKKVGSTLIGLNSQLHEFVVSVSQSEASDPLKIQDLRMKDDEYIPNVDFVLRHASPSPSCELTANYSLISFDT